MTKNISYSKNIIIFIPIFFLIIVQIYICNNNYFISNNVFFLSIKNNILLIILILFNLIKVPFSLIGGTMIAIQNLKHIILNKFKF
jgi:hypothetical protein